MLVLDAFLEARLDQDRCEAITRGFIDDVMVSLGMEALGELGIYPANDPRAPGWSFIQPITTSHVSGHYFEKPGRHPHIRLDAYSCESVRHRRLIALCHQHFRLGDWRATFIDREIDQPGRRRVLDLAGAGPNTQIERSLTPKPDAKREVFYARR
jgi:hypothetical protein